MAVLLTLVIFLASPPLLQAQDEAGTLYARVNALRASVGRAAYSYNGALAAAAQDQAQWMAQTGAVSHTRPDGSGPRTRALNAGYPSTMVGENIYIGGLANVDNAWEFWINSPVHYNGMIDTRYNDIGVGVAHGSAGAAYVLVFGNAGGPPPPPPASGGGGSASGGGGSASPPVQQAPPAYVLGLDARGNIMHEVQPGDTLGDIAVIYGYSWDDLPAMMALNGVTDVRDLEVGTIFLVPPHAGTYTPTPGGPSDTPTPVPTATPAPPTLTPIPPSITPYVALHPLQVSTLVVTPIILLTASPTASPTLAPTAIFATAAQLPSALAASPTPALTEVAALPTASAPPPLPPGRDGGPNWLLLAIGLQVGVVVLAGVEYVRRRHRP